MSVEPRRGCGFRKTGGLYLVGGGRGIPCDRLPFELTVCPCCSQGIKPARGFTWVDVAKLFQGPHTRFANEFKTQPYPRLVVGERELCDCAATNFCPLCVKPEVMGKAGLLWVGEKFYKTPESFIQEGQSMTVTPQGVPVPMGFSRRIKAVPQGFKIGETWVLLAHQKAVHTVWPTEPDTYTPGIFYVWRPTKLEKILPDTMQGSKEVADLEKRGISVVFVPAGDKDHQGTVYDKDQE